MRKAVALLTLFAYLTVAVPPASAAETPVAMQNSMFTPKEIVVGQGGTVTWTNKDAVVHTVTADDNSFDSGDVDKAGTFKMTFGTPGKIPYFCRIHGTAGGVGMAGTITVLPLPLP